MSGTRPPTDGAGPANEDRAVFFATASRGTEEALAGELVELGATPVETARGGVAFGTALEDAYRACLWSRVASRVLFPVTRFEADSADALYEAVSEVPWAEHVGSDGTMAVLVAGGRSPVGPAHYLALKTKDAIVDVIRAAQGVRPDIDSKRPDVRVHVHVRGTSFTVGIDLAGVGLHHRGVERPGAAAPLRETLAAALLRIAGWHEADPGTPLFDPMCGSGTLLTEAAAMRLDLAPGLERDHFGAQRWRGHDPELWRRLRREAEQRRDAAAGTKVFVHGADSSRTAIRAARERWAALLPASSPGLEVRELADTRPPGERPGLVVTNPPYGQRLGEAGELAPLYEQLGDVLKRRFPGWTAWILSGNPALLKRVGLRASARVPVWNGPIECRFVRIAISSRPVAGDSGPGWRKAGPDAAGFERKLRDNYRSLRSWAGREGWQCFRVYDSDVPIYNVAVDWYDGAVRVEEYERPRKVSQEDAERRLRDVLQVVRSVFGVETTEVALRVRRRLTAGEQHPRFEDRGRYREVREGDLRFRVNLHDFLDTGLFLDDRLLRRRIRRSADGAHFLNLFAYTCTASVAAAAGGARSTTSVDLSRLYLEWGKRNYELNRIDDRGHRLIRADVFRFLEDRRDRRRYGLAFVAPPSRSRSKAMRGELDVQRDHAALLRAVAGRMTPGGEILFATNLRSFELDVRSMAEFGIEEITATVTPRDFERRPRFRAWSIRNRWRKPRKST